MTVPNNEVRVGLLHDEFLRTNVLLLSCVHYVPLFQNLHGKGFVLITLELNLQSGGSKNMQTYKVSLNVNLRGNCKEKKIQIMLLSHCGAPYQFDTTESANPQSVNDVEVSQVEIKEKCILCFIPGKPGKAEQLWEQD